MISAIVLAAGTSSRMGRPKPLARLNGRPILEHVLSTLRGSNVGQIVVVLGHESDRVRREVSLDGVRVVLNPDFAAGMSTSIRAGLRASDGGAGGFLIVLADQPLVSPSTLDALIRRRSESTAKILVPTFRGVRGNPVLVDRSLSDAIESITGDRGFRAIFGDHPDEILEVPVDDPGVLVDLDTEEDLERVQGAVAGGETLEALVTPVPRVRTHIHAHELPGQTRRSVRPPVDILALSQELRSRDEPFSVATVVRTVRPTSGKPGNKAVVRPGRRIAGWIGGSCAESVVVAESLAAIRDGRPRLLRLSKDIGSRPSEEGVVEYVMECHSGGSMEIYIEPHLPKPRLLIVGDSPVAETLSVLGRLLGFRVVLVAPEASRDAFPDADEVVDRLERLRELITENTFAVVATMGKYDGTAMLTLAPSPVSYLGLVASRPRAEAMMEDLRREGVSAEALGRVRNPAGLDLAAHTSEEIALGIMAEITKARRTASPRERATEGAASVPPAPEHVVDPVCGMDVDPRTPLRDTHEGKEYRFCSEGCRSRFHRSPGEFTRSGA